jgi:hypothetical protein
MIPAATFLSRNACKAAVAVTSLTVPPCGVVTGDCEKMVLSKRVKSVGMNARHASVKRSRF